MSEKRSDRLRTLIAATVSDAAADAAPVTVIGSSMATTNRREPRVTQLDAPDSPHVLPGTGIPRVPQSIGELPTAVTAPAQHTSTPTSEMPANQALTVDTHARQNDVRAALRAPQRPIRLAKWEKANVTLEPRDLAILQRSDTQARAYGFRIRKGGNPSLFVRAGLRLLDELGDRDPEEWIKRIAATTSLASEHTE